MNLLEFLTNETVIFFIANTLYVISYALSSMLWLRALAVIAAASTMPYFYLQLEPLWSALFWQACFLLVNLVNLVILLYSMKPPRFDTMERLAYNIKFSDLKKHEVAPIFNHSHRMNIPDGHVLLEKGAENQCLYLILHGAVKIMKNGEEVARLTSGHFVGELSFIDKHPTSADVIAVGETRLMYWNRETLEPLFRKQGLYEAYFYSLCSSDMAAKLRETTRQFKPA